MFTKALYWGLWFLLYVNGLPQYVQNQNCNIFADDTIIYSFGSNVEELSYKMQGALDSIMPWYMTNRLSINVNKSAAMLIGRPSQVHDDIDVQINDVRIEQVQSLKYLGIYIDNKLSWDVQCDKLCSNVAGKISVLRRIRQFCRPSTLKLIYERMIQPTFDYACSVWCHTKQGNISKLQRVKTTLLELLRETLIMSISEVLIYYRSSTGHRSKRDVIILHR